MHYRVPSSIFEKHTYCTKIVNYLQKLRPSAKLPGRRTNLPRRCRVNDGPYLGDPVGWEAATLGMLANQLLVRRQVHTIDLVVGHEALHPLNLRTELLQHAAGLLGDPLQRIRRKAACSREFTLDHKLVHRFLLELSFRFRTGLAPRAWPATNRRHAGKLYSCTNGVKNPDGVQVYYPAAARSIILCRGEIRF